MGKARTLPKYCTPTDMTSATSLLPVRTCVLCQKNRVRCTGTATMFNRLSAVAVRSLADESLRTSSHVRTACDHNANA